MKYIKFRAWDDKENKYHYFTGIFNERPYIERSTFPQYESCPEYHELKIEQFTGRNDKNGKEIYQGDRYTYANQSPIHLVGDLVAFGDELRRLGDYNGVKYPYESELELLEK